MNTLSLRIAEAVNPLTEKKIFEEFELSMKERIGYSYSLDFMEILFRKEKPCSLNSEMNIEQWKKAAMNSCIAQNIPSPKDFIEEDFFYGALFFIYEINQERIKKYLQFDWQFKDLLEKIKINISSGELISNSVEQ